MKTISFVQTQNNASLVVLMGDKKVFNYELSNNAVWTIGRPTSGNVPDIPLYSAIVSRKHAKIICIGSEWYYIDDNDNANGTYYNGKKIKDSTPVFLHNGDVLRIDSNNLSNPDPRGIWMMFTTEQIDGIWENYTLHDNKEVYIGRDSELCDITLKAPYISGQHCCLSEQNGKFYVSDCNSLAGTWVNNKRISEITQLKEKDKISLCDKHFIFTGNGLIYNNDDGMDRNIHNGRILLQADIDTKIVKDINGKQKKELIKDIHLEIKKGTLVALLGGSGAGKTTVMNCLNGMDTVGVKGVVYFNGENLFENFERLKLRIGSVPQENVIHGMFTVEQELLDAAEARLPKGTSKSERKKRVDTIIEQLGLEKQRNTLISKCSGGEQSRVNIGMDLVADKELFCLDEPDKGLDPKSKVELFTILSNLAHNEGKSILVIIHDVSEINLFDQIVMMAKVDNVGRLAFSGSPEEGEEYFGTDIKHAYELLDKYPEKYVRK